jgi:spermidine synthase
MLVNVKPADKTVYMTNLTAAGFEFTTKPKSKIVTVDCGEGETLDEVFRLLEVKEE